MPWYEPHAAPADLGAILACSWTATPSGRHRLVPDACVELLWLTTGQVIVCGPERRAWTFELPKPTCAVGVRFRPGAAGPMLGLDISRIRDRRIRWAELTSKSDEARLSGAIGAAIRNGADLRAGVRLLEAEVRRMSLGHGRGTESGNDGLAESVLACLSRPVPVTQAVIAAELGLSPRQLHRRSVVLFGYGTSILARLLRFQRLLSVTTMAADMPLAQRACRAGYSDQAHMTRDCRAIAGLTPTAFFAEYFPTFPDMSDPFKTAASAPLRLTA